MRRGSAPPRERENCTTIPNDGFPHTGAPVGLFSPPINQFHMFSVAQGRCGPRVRCCVQSGPRASLERSPGQRFTVFPRRRAFRHCASIRTRSQVPVRPFHNGKRPSEIAGCWPGENAARQGIRRSFQAGSARKSHQKSRRAGEDQRSCVRMPNQRRDSRAGHAPHQKKKKKKSWSGAFRPRVSTPRSVASSLLRMTSNARKSPGVDRTSRQLPSDLRCIILCHRDVAFYDGRGDSVLRSPGDEAWPNGKQRNTPSSW